MPFTARQLLDNTPGIIRDRTRICSIKLNQEGRHTDDPEFGRCYEMVYDTRCTDGIRRVTLKYIGKRKPGLSGEQGQEAGLPTPDSEVWVSCTCPFHLFTNEYSLTRKRNSDILYSNGQPAHVRNPNNLGYVCKHTLLALETSFREVEKAKPKESPKSISTEERKQRMRETQRFLDLRDPEGKPYVTQEKTVDTKPTEKSRKIWRNKLKDFITQNLPDNGTWTKRLEDFLTRKVDPAQSPDKVNKEIDKFITEENKGQPTTWRDKLKKWLK